MKPICAVYDETREQLYLGQNSKKAENIAKSIAGISHFKMYHKVGDEVRINDSTFSDGKLVGKELLYIPKSEIEILIETLE